MATQRERLGAELRRLRELAGVTGRQVAEAVGINQSTVSRIEAGRVVPSLPQAEAWLDAVSAEEDRRVGVLSMVEPALNEIATWRTLSSGGVPTLQGQVQQLEASAGLIRNYQPTMVPGLLQTARYARAVFSSGTINWQDIGTAVTQRLERQQALYEPGRHFEFLLTEAGLMWNPGPDAALRGQFDRVASLASLDSVRLGIIPTGAETKIIPAHPYIIFEELDDGSPAFVQAEMLHAVLTTFARDDVAQYVQHYERASSAAAWGEEALALIAAITARLP
jgi:transcriptional regulator with XRE-family HTH domain